MAVRMWIREDGEQPKAVARDAVKAPGPGRLVDVDAPTSAAARKVIALSKLSEPSEANDPQGWLAWRQAKRQMREVQA